MNDVGSVLDDLRAQFPSCITAAYADISAGMILATSSDHQLPQERWDELCETASALLQGDLAGDVSGLFVGTSIGYAVIVEPGEVGVFVRSAVNPDDAMCCLCGPSDRIADLISSAQKCLSEISLDD